MKLLLPLVVAFLAIAQVFCEEIGPKEELDYWTDSNQIQQDGWLSNGPLREILRRMTRKPRPHQFIGLMGKRSPAEHDSTSTTKVIFSPFPPQASTQITRKRHKINSFVGLMGKRSQEEPDSYEWSTIQTYDKRR